MQCSPAATLVIINLSIQDKLDLRQGRCDYHCSSSFQILKAADPLATAVEQDHLVLHQSATKVASNNQVATVLWSVAAAGNLGGGGSGGGGGQGPRRRQRRRRQSAQRAQVYFDAVARMQDMVVQIDSSDEEGAAAPPPRAEGLLSPASAGASRRTAKRSQPVFVPPGEVWLTLDSSCPYILSRYSTSRADPHRS